MLKLNDKKLIVLDYSSHLSLFKNQVNRFMSCMTSCRTTNFKTLYSIGRGGHWFLLKSSSMGSSRYLPELWIKPYGTPCIFLANKTYVSFTFK